MPETVVLCLVGALFVIVLLPVLWAWRLALSYPPRDDAPVDDKDLPRAGVVLCLRGTDPSLDRCLAGLMTQDYPDYSVWIVVDSEDDVVNEALPAILEKVSQPSVPVHVHFLQEPLPTCSLKLSAQNHAIAELRQTCSVVAFIDADVVPHAGWLRSLVVPLLDPGVGATTGVRWYTPGGESWGTVTRYLWNAGAVTQMYFFGIPWGGSLAFRIDAIDRAGLIDQWTHSFCEDTSSPRRLWQAGLKLRFAFQAVMVNQETIDLKDALSFVRRQLVCARLHHPSWIMIVLSNLAQALALPAAIALALVCWLGGQEALAVCALAIPTFYVGGLLSAILWGERQIRRTMSQRGIVLPTFVRSWRAWLALPLLQVVHAGCILSAMALRRVSWRGVTYELEGHGKIRLVQYHPYGVERQADSAKSLV
jgi:cellulose synthase/poly-beta-1,6-N-acetylglucosamine synthase-like glycosyltransferase